MDKLSFKDIVLQSNPSFEPNEKEYTYEQVINLIGSKPKPQSTCSQLTYDYLDDQSDSLNDAFNVLKTKHSVHGFMTDMSMLDFLNILAKNTTVEEISSEQDDQETFAEDEDLF